MRGFFTPFEAIFACNLLNIYEQKLVLRTIFQKLIYKYRET